MPSNLKKQLLEISEEIAKENDISPEEFEEIVEAESGEAWRKLFKEEEANGNDL